MVVPVPLCFHHLNGVQLAYVVRIPNWESQLSPHIVSIIIQSMHSLISSTWILTAKACKEFCGLQFDYTPSGCFVVLTESNSSSTLSQLCIRYSVTAVIAYALLTIANSMWKLQQHHYKIPCCQADHNNRLNKNKWSGNLTMGWQPLLGPLHTKSYKKACLTVTMMLMQ